MLRNRCESLGSDEAAAPERVRSRSPIGRDDGDDESFSPVVKKTKGKKRAAGLRLEEEAESVREKAEKEREKEKETNEEAELERRRAEERSTKAEADRRAANDRAATVQGGRKSDAVGHRRLDQVKNGIIDVYVVCENITSAPKKVKMEV